MASDDPATAALPTHAPGRSAWIPVVLLLGLCCFLYLQGLGVRPLWDIDEAKHAATSRQIVETGDWIVPVNNGEPFRDKPILHSWFVSIAFVLLGFTEFAARLPAALLGAGCAFLTWLLGRRMFSPRAAFLAAVVLATSAMMIVISRTVVHDISLAFFVTASLVAFHAAYRSARPRLGILLVFWISLALAILAKGPIDAVFVGMPAAILILRDRRWRFPLEMRPFLGVLIVLGIAAPWYVLMSERVPGYAYYFFIERHVGGFVSGDRKGSQPLWAYVPVVLGGMLPWALLLPVAIYRAIRRPGRADRGDLVFLLAWFGAGFVFLSLASAKLPTYVLPLFPPLALMLGRCWAELFSAPRDESLGRAFTWSLGPFAIVLGLGALGLWIWPLTRVEEKYSVPTELIAGLVTVAALIMGIGWLASRRRAPVVQFGAYLLVPILFVPTFVWVLSPILLPHRASKQMSLLIDRLLPEGEPIPTFCYPKEGGLFYTSRTIALLRRTPDFIRFMDTPERVFCLVDQDDIEKALRSGAPAFVVAREGDTYIVSNRSGELQFEDEPPRSR